MHTNIKKTGFVDNTLFQVCETRVEFSYLISIQNLLTAGRCKAMNTISYTGHLAPKPRDMEEMV